MQEQTLITLHRLTRSFAGRAGQPPVPAVREVSLAVAAGETLGVVGESGCGKSTLGRMVVGLLRPDSGEVFVRGLPLYDKKAHADYAAFRKSLAGKMQMVFQDPYSSLNPRMRVGESVAEALLCTGHGRKAASRRVHEMLEQVGLDAGGSGSVAGGSGGDAGAARRYPHEFSGGQRQRIAIARALVTSPDFVVCDEPTSSLDASVQSQVLNLLRDMQEALRLTYLFISHDLAVVRHMSDRVAVMYKGQVVELGASEAIFKTPLHPYTRLLLASVPGVSGSGIAGPGIACPDAPGTSGAGVPLLPGGAFAPGGCLFAPRCPHARGVCREEAPDLLAPEASGARLLRCHSGAA